MHEYAIRKTGLFSRQRFIICKQVDGSYHQLQPEDLNQNLVDYLTRAIRNDVLMNDKPWEFDLAENALDDFAGEFIAIAQKYYYPISCGNMELRITNGRVKAYSTSTGIEFRLEGIV